MNQFNTFNSKYFKFEKINSQLIIIIIIDEMDLMKIPKIRKEFDQLFEEFKLPSIIFDLNNVKYIDSIGISFLIMLNRKMKKAGKKLAILCNYEPLIQVFNAVQINKFLNIFSDINNASRFITDLKSIS